jgi:hypothetical protein
MLPLFPFLSLLLCLIAASADELPVIKDSEAVQGRNGHRSLLLRL